MREDIPELLLKIEGLRVKFCGPSTKVVDAVNGVSIEIHQGQAYGLVGESGCGKTTTGLAALGLLDSDARTEGSVLWQGREMLGAPERRWRDVRGRGITMVFQDAMGSLNPALRVGRQLLAVLYFHQRLTGAAAHKEAVRLLEAMKLAEPERVMNSYPHQCSGGMAQRVALALALACRPQLLIADEPTSALDVTIAAQISDLLGMIRDEFGLAILVISHDLRLISRLCHKVSVMRNGSIVESGTVKEAFGAPKHPYTRTLIDAAKWDPLTVSSTPTIP